MFSRLAGTSYIGPILILLISALPSPLGAQAPPAKLAQASLEDLLNMEITSVSRKEQKLVNATAAVYVITQEDIRRSGLNSIPEILRLAPGLDVAKIDVDRWAISSRGFNAQFSRYLLVLLDGRSVYLPADGGVYWDELDTLIEDIDRIEVIRGPGATVWGANAVNGVINIITKPAAQTKGLLVTVAGGTGGRSLNGIRFGQASGQSGAYRIFGKYTRRPDLPAIRGAVTEAGWSAGRLGFRGDWNLSTRDFLTVEGDLFHETAGISLKLPTFVSPYTRHLDGTERTTAGNLLFDWNHRASDKSMLTMRGSLSQIRKSYLPLLAEDRKDGNLEFQHEWVPAETHEFIWGLGFRYNLSAFENSETLSFLPARQKERLYSSFGQYSYWLVPDRWRITLGSKFERNDFTGMEVLPSGSLLWTPSRYSAAWVGVSRAVRIPSYFELGADLSLAIFPGQNGLLNVMKQIGSPDVLPETLRAHEAGYRRQIGSRFTLDGTAFYNLYHHLSTVEPGSPYLVSTSQPPYLALPMYGASKMWGSSNGTEVTGSWEVTSRWRVSSSYSWLNLQLHLEPGSRNFFREEAEHQSPHNQIQVRSNLDLTNNAQLDTYIYRVGALAALDVPAYTRLDVRLGWRPCPVLDLSLIGQNLQGGRHTEYVSEGPFGISQITRAVYLRATWSFGGR